MEISAVCITKKPALLYGKIKFLTNLNSKIRHIQKNVDLNAGFWILNILELRVWLAMLHARFFKLYQVLFTGKNQEHSMVTTRVRAHQKCEFLSTKLMVSL